MTTVAQAKKVVGPLIERNPDLGLIGRLIVVKPVHHLLRGIYIGRSLDPTIFTPTWFFTFMFEKGAHATFNWGTRLYNKAHGPWEFANPATTEVMADEIERKALPLLRPLRSIDDAVSFIADLKDRYAWTALEHFPLRRIVVDVARGDLTSARALLDRFLLHRDGWLRSSMWREEFIEVVEPLTEPLLANDVAALAQILHDWEANSVKKLKLEKFWEPTPFPLEKLQGRPRL